MKLQHITKHLAIWMIMLVLTMPFIVAQSTVTVTSYSGQDGVQGYMRSFDDYLEINAEVELDENASITNYTNSNLYIEIFSDEEAFDSCEASGDLYTCAYTTSQADRSGATKNFVVTLYDDDTIELASAEEYFYIDEVEPSIDTLSLPTYLTGDFNVSIEVTDTACSTCGDVCAGIETLEILFQEETVGSITVGNVSDEESTCAYSENYETSVTDLSLSEGEQEFCLLATDRVQNQDETCRTITVDTTAPSISTSSFVIKDQEGNAIEHISAAAVDATVMVNITEGVSGLDTSSVIADLSALNYLNGENYQEAQAVCNAYDDGLYVCYWSVYIELIDADGNSYLDETAQITINATDNAGNAGSTSKSIGFVEDEESPIVLSLTSAFGEYLNAQNNTLTLEIQEESSGFDDNNVYLDMSDAGLGQKQADYCEDAGTIWYCYWESLVMPSSLSHGKQVDLTPGTIEDDAGNAYDEETSIEETRFTYDEEGPEFINITISALGREADVITEGDVVSILAYLTDDVSGVDEGNVYADFSDFDYSNEYAAADYCGEVEADLWECYWEYIGSLDAGESIELNVLAYDEAGNSKDSDDDNVQGEIRVVGTLDSSADFWAEEVAVDTPPMLNPNFLYFTSTGTMVRFDTELVSNGANPYVHSFQYQNCVASADLPSSVTEQDWYDASIVGQYYYDEEDRTSKYVLVQIPSFFYGQANATVEEGSYVDVTCTATVSQAASVYSDIYGEDESVNLTVSIPLYAGLYAEPSLTNVDKIQKAQKFLDTVEKINKILGFWSEWGQKICGPINGVRVIANNMVTMLKSINTLSAGQATGAVAGMVEVTNFLNQIWYGARNTDSYDVQETQVGDTGTFEKTYMKDRGFLKNKYRFPSLGYICDTVLCESCSEQWNSMLGSWTNRGTSQEDMPQGMYIAGEYVSNLVNSKYLGSWPFNPRENMVVALVCNPPCVPGIYAQLNIYREILIAYNTCLNIATMKGEDIVQCDEFLAAQICQNMVNAFFWHWFWGGLQSAFSKFAVDLVFEKAIKEMAACTGTFKDYQDPNPSCSGYRTIVALTTLVTTAVDTYNTVTTLFNFEGGLFGNKTNEENVDELEAQVEEDIGDQLGTTPTY